MRDFKAGRLKVTAYGRWLFCFTFSLQPSVFNLFTFLVTDFQLVDIACFLFLVFDLEIAKKMSEKLLL